MSPTNSKSNIIITQLQHFKHLRRSVRMSAPVDADVCVGRRGWFVEAIRTGAHIVPDHETTSAYILII